jgi:glyoxylase-like metal-dependent hydrolase (beta-lactamase superfamily II)/rhodanese-related sulfurtransferase
MIIKQFEYKPLAHYSYAIVSNGEMAVIDPERDARAYLAFAEANNATIKAVIQTHPHADFVSSHLEIHKKTKANIYNSEKIGADYDHKYFDEGDTIQLGDVTLKAINTPGHSPDSITILATSHNKTVLFTGDTLFIGDVGRPDLREKAGNLKAKREELAAMMYETVTHKFNDYPDDTLIYPAHGAGSLCGKNLSDAASSTLGDERRNNWAFQKQTKEQFMEVILEGQPFIPSYFGFNVDINKKGAENLQPSIDRIPFKPKATATGLIIDVRAESKFKKGHLPGSINIQAVTENSKFETWLGSIVTPKEVFTLVIEDEKDKDLLLQRVAKIGYEAQLSQIITLPKDQLVTTPQLDVAHFKNNPDQYTIIDIRNSSEVEEEQYFKNAIAIPLNELRENVNDIETALPIVVHCAGGYRSATGSSIIADVLKEATVYDLSEDINQFKN